MNYFFAVIGSQESNFAALRDVFDTSKINRFMSRIEESVPNIYEGARPLVVIGSLGLQPQQRINRFDNALYMPHVRSEPFVTYRQVEILNFFAGKYVFRSPTADQVASAKSNSLHRKAWPSTESVFTDHDTIVLLLEPYAASVPVTEP